MNVADLAVSGPRFSNAGGTLQVTNTFSAQVEQFDNSAGNLRAGTIDIHATGDIVNGDGQMRSDSDLALHADGQVSSSGSITAARHLHIDAGSVQGGSASTFGSGVRADGTLGTEGDLHLGAASTLAANGRNIAVGAASGC